jgi:hypothetical protein
MEESGIYQKMRRPFLLVLSEVEGRRMGMQR